MLAPVTHFLPLTTVRRRRLLPIPGTVMVRRGQRVSGDDVIAEAILDARHVILNVKKVLNVTDKQLEGVIQCRVNEFYEKGAILAGPVGIFHKVIRAPENGVVQAIADGQILFEVRNRSYQLKAGLSGEVVELVPDRGAIIEATGVLIQGVWGNRKANTGLLMAKVGTTKDSLTISPLDTNLRGTVVIANYCDDPEIIRLGNELHFKGLVLAGITPNLIEMAEQAEFPIMLIDGFGKMSLNNQVLELISGKDNQEVSINAERWNRFTGTRPELFIPIPTISDVPMPNETAEFLPNQMVRIVTGVEAGKIGVITHLGGYSVLSNRIKTHVAELRLQDGNEVVVPLTNLEVIQ